jgi:outer membrane protein OmpU
MKNILFATTALVAFAGTAAYAQGVEIGGRAEVGIVGGTAGDGAGVDSTFGTADDTDFATQFHTDVDIDFTLRGEADNGLTFGADLDIDETGGGMPQTDDYGVTYFLAFGNMRMEAGDTDGAFDWAMAETNLAGAASIDDAETLHAGFNGNAGLDGVYDGQIMRFQMTFGDFAAALSFEVDDANNFDPVYGFGLTYSGDLGGVTLGVGLGYQQADETNANNALNPVLAVAQAEVAAVGAAANSNALLNAVRNIGINPGVDAAEAREVIGLSISAGFQNGITTALNYSEAQYGTRALTNTATETHIGIGVGYEMNALEVGLNYGEYDNRYGVNGLQASGFGLAVNYDLGGGLEVQAAYSNSEVNNARTSYDYDQFSLGVAMSF